MKRILITLILLFGWVGMCEGAEIKPICVWYQGMPTLINPNDKVIISGWYSGVPSPDYFDITSTSQAGVVKSLFPVPMNKPIWEKEVQGDGIK